MAHVGILQHFWCEPAGEFEAALRAAGQRTTMVALCDGHAVPAVGDFDAWLVMDEPTNVDETERYAFLRPERELLAELIGRDRPVMGVCLGAQLVARAAGARVYAQRPKEIGLFTIEPTEKAAADPLFSLLAGPTEVFQWHGDTFDLPAGAVHLARSARFEQQAFRLGRRVYGLQFHVECNGPLVRQWCETWAGELAKLPPGDGFEQYEARLEASLARQRGLAGGMIGRWVGLFD